MTAAYQPPATYDRRVRPRVSVLLPYRDAADTLDDAVDSVVGQRGVDVELIAIDDGSRDDGPARVARIAGTIALSTGGRGLVAALTAGLRAATANWIARMDADDVCDPDRLAAQVDLMASDPTLGACGTQVDLFGDAPIGDGLRRYVRWQNRLITPEDHARELFVEAPLCHPSVVLRRDALVAVGGWRDTGGPEDYDLWLRLDAAGWRLAKVPRPLLRWRHRAGRMTFSDPRLARARFVDAKAPHLARRLRALGRPIAVWGAGRSGKRLARALERWGAAPALFVDVAASRIGRIARGCTVRDPTALRRGEHAVVVAVGAIGARDDIRAHLDAAGFREGADYWVAA